MSRLYDLLNKMLTPRTEIYTTSGLTHLASAEASATREGKNGLLIVAIKNTGADIAAGGDASCDISMPRLAGYCRGIGYSGTTAMVATISPTGHVTFRVIGGPWIQNYTASVTIPILYD